MVTTRVIRDIPELVSILRDQQARCRDFVAPVATMNFMVDAITEEKKPPRLVPVLRIQGRTWGIQPHVHQQICDKTEIPKRYYETLLDLKAPDLLATNVNYWLARDAQRGTARLIRTIDQDIRAFLSDRYRPINHLDVLTTAVQVITGKDGRDGEAEPWARGARCLTWHLNPTHLDVCFINPSVQADLNRLDKGLLRDTVELDPEGDHYWITGTPNGRRPMTGDEGGSHIVFPSCRITNSETGHGGLTVRAGICEAVCINTAWLGTDLVQVHLGKKLEEGRDIYSAKTYERMNAAIFAQVADIVRAVFEPESFLKACRKMKGLADVELKMEVKEVIGEIVKLPGLTEDIRDDILQAYKPLGRRDTALDIQRAVTQAAQKVAQKDAAMGFTLEELGGKMIESGLAVIHAA